MKIKFLGTGTSHGIPVVACQCPVCKSKDPHDARYRSSILLTDGQEETNNKVSILFDAGPEFRLQAIRAQLKSIDALFITHAHADHAHGIDDVRPLTKNKSLPVYASPLDIKELKSRFSYAFHKTQAGGGKPKLLLSNISQHGVCIKDIRITPVPIIHGNRLVYGYKTDKFAYLTDCSFIPESSKKLLHGLDLIIIDALRLRPHPTHFSIPEAIAIGKELKPKRMYLTHICHDLNHEQIIAFCKSQNVNFEVLPAYDGLELEV